MARLLRAVCGILLTYFNGRNQGCSLGLECLGLETVSVRFFERLGLVSVSRLKRLDIVSVSASYVSFT